MSASVDQVQPESQASPLAEDILHILRTQLRGGSAPPQPMSRSELARKAGVPEGILSIGNMESQLREHFETPQQRQGLLDAEAFGTGVGPLQREAGTAIRQFAQSGPAALPQELQNAMEQRQATARSDAMAELGEQFGQAGNLLGTPSQVGQAQLLSRLVPRQTEQFFDQRREFGQQHLSALDLMSRMGRRNIEPFLALAGQGIMPEQTVVRENPFMTGLKAIAGVGQGAGTFMQGLNSG